MTDEEHQANMARAETFANELAATLNRACAENGSNTPDFILASYMIECLYAFNRAVNWRAEWYGRKDTPGGSTAVAPPDGGSGPAPVDPRGGA